MSKETNKENMDPQAQKALDRWFSTGNPVKELLLEKWPKSLQPLLICAIQALHSKSNKQEQKFRSLTRRWIKTQQWLIILQSQLNSTQRGWKTVRRRFLFWKLKCPLYGKKSTSNFCYFDECLWLLSWQPKQIVVTESDGCYFWI